jgi:hypothetical protein
MDDTFRFSSEKDDAELKIVGFHFAQKLEKGRKLSGQIGPREVMVSAFTVSPIIVSLSFIGCFRLLKCLTTSRMVKKLISGHWEFFYISCSVDVSSFSACFFVFFLILLPLGH